jgi:integrase
VYHSNIIYAKKLAYIHIIVKYSLECGLGPDKYLFDAQLKKLRQYVKDKADLARVRGGSRGIIDELIVELLVNTGLRASKLCDLNISDLPIKHGKECIWIRDGKGKVSRSVEISEKLKKRLKRFVKPYRYPKGTKAKSPCWSANLATESYIAAYTPK